jgi:hypothetical protein
MPSLALARQAPPRKVDDGPLDGSTREKVASALSTARIEFLEALEQSSNRVWRGSDRVYHSFKPLNRAEPVVFEDVGHSTEIDGGAAPTAVSIGVW